MILYDDLKINTIYIISKGRPQCNTAKAFTKMNYPGEWFIVCGNNDETLPQYIQNWGKDRVLIFDWYEEIKHTNTLDNFGFEKRASGACPVRNAVQKISWERGELRHWQFDDDFTGFRRYNGKSNKNEAIKDGRILFSTMYRLAEYGYKADLSDIGYSSTDFNAMPTLRKSVSLEVGCAHNMPSDPSKWTEWVGRGSDDFIHSYHDFLNGKIEISLHYLQFAMPLGADANTDKIKGGLEEFRNNDGMIRRMQYIFLMMPGFSRLKYKDRMFRTVRSYKYIRPKILQEKWAKY